MLILIYEEVRRYSIFLGRRRSYRELVKPSKAGPAFAFVGIDATLTPSPKRPFNFFGALSDHDMDEIHLMLEDSSKPENSMGGLITFGHYPLSTVLTPGNDDLSGLIGKVGAAAYLRYFYPDLLLQKYYLLTFILRTFILNPSF